MTTQPEPLIFERSRPGRVGVAISPSPFPEAGRQLPKELLREDLPLPEVSQPEVVRHYTRLSQLNFSIDTGFYPLGSCTMKHNPRVNEAMAALPGFSQLHPLAPPSFSQGALRIIFEMEQMLKEICGFDAATLQPSAGAHGEFTGMLMVRKYLESRGELERKNVLIPDSAHGTNPASCTLVGFKAVQIPTNKRGTTSLKALKEALDGKTAAIMLTNPSTLGLFESDIEEVCRLVHEAGGLVYMDGANLNALMGKVKPGDMGVDLMHINLHKTFSTPHGGGGPGSGPVAVKSFLEPFLPAPIVKKEGEALVWDYDRPQSVGRVNAFQGHFGMLVRAYTYIRSLGAEGLRAETEAAVLNANYLRERLKGTYHLPYDSTCMHEAVFSDKLQKDTGVKTLDIAKRLMDYGFHPPTVYFPLIVHGALMIEPTESETVETLDRFVEAMKEIARECVESPETVLHAPHTAPCKRLDEVKAAKDLDLNYFFKG